MLEHARRIREIWDYLPAFRAVAETEHLPTAARALHVSPSALSRAIRMIEDRSGELVFERSGRRMRLNAAGHSLLEAVRTAMRYVDEALAGDAGGAVVIAATSNAAWLAGPALAELNARTPPISPTIVGAPVDVATALRRGELDVVVTCTPSPTTAGVESDEVAVVPWAVYGAPGVRRGDDVRFVVSTDDPWHHGSHAIGARVADLGLAAFACGGSLVAWLPEPVARLHGLVRVRRHRSVRRPVYAVHRAAVSRHPRTDAVIASLRSAARQRRTPRT